VTSVLSPSQHLLFVTLSSWLAMAGGFLIWIGFVFFSLIARRFEKAFGKVTHWQFSLIAPVGATLYLIFQAVASLEHNNLGPIEQWVGYTFLVWAAGLSLWGVVRLWNLVNIWCREE
jgi:hypothetical protein